MRLRNSGERAMTQRTHFIILALLLSALPLFSFAGKPKTPDKVIRLYYKSSDKVVFEIYSFTNKSKFSNLNYLSRSVPEQIVEQIASMGELVILSNELKLTPVNYNKRFREEYETNVISNRFHMSNLSLVMLTNYITNISNYSITITNEQQATNISSNEYETNDETVSNVYTEQEAGVAAASNASMSNTIHAKSNTITNEAETGSNLAAKSNSSISNSPISGSYSNTLESNTNYPLNTNGLLNANISSLTNEAGLTNAGNESPPPRVIHLAKTNVRTNVFKALLAAGAVASNFQNERKTHYSLVNATGEHGKLIYSNHSGSNFSFHYLLSPQTNGLGSEGSSYWVESKRREKRRIFIRDRDEYRTYFETNSFPFEGSQLLEVKTNYITNLVKKTNIYFIDGKTESLILETNEFIFNYKGTNVIVLDNNFLRRKPVLPSKLKPYPSNETFTFVENLKEANKADIVISGSILAEDEFSSLITTKVYRLNSGELYEYSAEIPSDEVDEKLPAYAYEIAARLNMGNSVSRVSFSSSPDESVLYMNGNYLGRIEGGLDIGKLPIGEYRFSVEKEGYNPVDKVLTFREKDGTFKVHFNLKKQAVDSLVNIKVTNTKGKVYIDGLYHGEKDHVKTRLDIGTHSLKIEEEGYETLFATFDVVGSNETFISTGLETVEELSKFKKFIRSYKRNSRILLISAVGVGLGGIALHMTEQELEDQVYARYNEIYPASSLEETEGYDNYERVRKGKIAATVVGGILGTAGGIFYVLDLRSYNYPVKNLSVVPKKGGADISINKRF